MMENIFTSTGVKMLHHPNALKQVKKGVGVPLSLQISPTSKCNLNCYFCSNVNRDKDEQLSLSVIERLIMELQPLGMRTVEWTGGGDPTLYPEINDAISLTYHAGLKQGFITNGIKAKSNLTVESLQRLHWLRISLNSLDYVDEIEVPIIKGTLGFSYVLNDKTTANTISKLVKYASVYKPAYVRIVPNCLATDEEQKYNNKTYSEIVAGWGHPFFYQAKRFEKPERCWWGYFKPFALHDGYVYRCSSVVLNMDAGRKFHEKYRWCSIEELPDMYKTVMTSFDPKHCNHCVFKPQNDLIDSVVNPSGMEDFV